VKVKLGETVTVKCRKIEAAAEKRGLLCPFFGGSWVPI